MGKNKSLSIILAALVIGAASSVGYSLLTEREHHVGLAKVYKNVEEINKDAGLVAKVTVPDTYKEVETEEGEKLRIERIYQVEVEKVYGGKKSAGVSKGDRINLSHAIGFKIGEAFYSVVENGQEEIAPGTYIMFLNPYAGQDGQQYYTNNSPNHLYKVEKNGKLKNVASKNLEEINEIEVEEANRK